MDDHSNSAGGRSLNSPISENANIPIISASVPCFEDEPDWPLLLFTMIATVWQNHNMPVSPSGPKRATWFAP